MKKPVLSTLKRAVRRKSAARGKQVVVRLQADELKAIDAWAGKQLPPVTRPEMIRLMIATVRKTGRRHLGGPLTKIRRGDTFKD
jgi:hypothetical protein